ncbi:hypothetical protein F5Y17DRAFT_447145 [Xylariaceae sp. FL0594]|nr:hypothetical protein F5Y17DRAFT_447145 [Xylariaceae sp. FL0594]
MAQEKMTLEDWLDDLCVRFIINLPREDLSSVARICFQIEEAQWFYEDFIRPLDPTLPSMSLRTFSMKMFQHCPLLASFSADTHLKAFDEFMQYKTRIPVRGAIMLNDAMDAAVLVRGYKKSAGWSFPRGKINKDEDDLDCAVREVYEETGFDLRAAGLVEKNEPVHPLEVTMHDQQVRLYVFRGVPEDTVFETRTRKEIGDIKWYKLSDLPAYRKKKGTGKNQGPLAPTQDRFYMVAPFMVQLRQWVLKQKKQDNEAGQSYPEHIHSAALDENLTDDNVLHEPVPNAPLSAHPENIDSATRELHRLLQIKPPTQGLQLPPTASSQPTGHDLLSILQPQTTTAVSVPTSAPLLANHPSHISREPHHVPVSEPPRQLQQHHTPSQGPPLSDYPGASSFPVRPNPGPGQNYQQYQQHRPRPHVFLPNDMPQSSQLQTFQHLYQSPQQYMNQQQRLQHHYNPPVQLVHPQPLPPQVQKALLLRDLTSPANVSGANTQPNAPSMPQGFDHAPQGSNGRVNQPPQLGTHPTNLLNVLKGASVPTTAAQHPVPRPSPLGRTMQLPRQDQVQQILGQGAGSAGHHGVTIMPTASQPGAILNAPAPFMGTSSRSAALTDRHRASLLDMFKTGQPTVSQSQADGQGTSLPPGFTRHGQPSSPRDQRSKQDPPTAEVLQAASRTNGKPAQNKPELSLPFGAHSILRRAASPGAARGSARSPRSPPKMVPEAPVPAPTQAPVRSHHSPASSRSHMSPYQSYLQARMQSPKQTASQPQAHTAPSFPYVGGGQGVMPNPIGRHQGNTAGSTQPPAVMVKPRQNSTVEHKNALLSMFGKLSVEPEQGKKSQEPTDLEQTSGSGPTPRSRLASFASQSQGSRRSSATPLSAADRNFLLGFLENASKQQ